MPDLFGPGFLTVSRLFESKADPRTSTVAFDDKGEPTGSGGLFLQALPDAPEEVIAGL